MPRQYLDAQAWPAFDESRLAHEEAKRFQRLQRAVLLYLAFAPMDQVLAACGLSERVFRRAFRRCGQIRTDGSLVGWGGLVKNRTFVPRNRKAEFSAQNDPRAGYGGMFQKLLAGKPQIESGLIAYLNARGTKALRPNTVTFRGLHRTFLSLCATHGVAPEQYPLNTRAGASRPLKAWIESVYMPAHANRFIRLQHGPNAAGISAYGEGDGSAQRVAPPYSEWILDEATIDLCARYEFPNASGDWEQLDLARFAQLRVRDKGGANLASKQVFATQASAEDIAMLLWDAVNGPPEVHAIEGLVPEEGADYPANCIPELRHAIPSVIYLDNALSHLAAIVQYIGLQLFGARVMLGAPKTPRERAEIESKFALVARRVLHQLPGTTGSGPKDPVRKIAAVPLEGRVHANDLGHVLDVYVKNENALPTAAAGNIAPLERLRRQLAANVLQPRYLPLDKRKAYFFSNAIRVRVIVNPKAGTRPYINYLYTRYSSAELGKRYDLGQKFLWVRADPRNLRTVMLFNDDGTLFGPVQALGHWGKFPHDVRMRKLFGRLKRDGELGARADDRPLEALFEHLRSKAPTDRRYALKLAYLVDYLVRNDVALGPELAEGVHEWKHLQQVVNDLTVLPAAANGPVATDVALVPRNLVPLVHPLPRTPTEGPPSGPGHGAFPRDSRCFQPRPALRG